MANRLQFEASPYLLQHKHNPVNWLPWDRRAFEKAHREDKPIFLSIGYSTCHWCHVMAHESFEDEAAAKLLNRAFVPIKVDREERPDVDAVYMSACIAMTGSGGWPLTVMMTPDQKPFWAGTYLPKDSLMELLTQVERLWHTAREHIFSAGEELTAILRQERETSSAAPTRDMVERAVEEYGRSFDPRWGGFGQAPKFPTAHNLLFLMRYSRLSKDAKAWDMAETTLEAMYRGGLFDHIGGGFSRYSTDRRWLVPHFEKMLYDNALLLFSYAEAYQLSRRPLWASVAGRCADYVLRELRSDEGGFYCGQDADSEGVEGKYYVFSPEEVHRVLGKDAANEFCRRYGVTEQGNFEGRSIPNLIDAADIDKESEAMEQFRETLRAYRLQRTSLHKDDKVLTAWNGLMIAAMAKAGFILDEPRYLDAARDAAKFIRANLCDENGRLLARWRDGQSAFPGKLDDYAFYCWGLLELYAATFDITYLAEAERLAGVMQDFFFDSENGGFYPYASDGEQLITRTKELFDGAMPSGNSVAALVLSRLARLSGEKRWIEAAKLQLSYLAGIVSEQPSGHSFAMLSLLEELWPSAELICASVHLPPELSELLREYTLSSLSVLLKTPGNRDTLAETAPYTADYPIPEEGAQYYLCKNAACSRPTDSIAELKAMMELD